MAFHASESKDKEECTELDGFFYFDNCQRKNIARHKFKQSKNKNKQAKNPIFSSTIAMGRDMSVQNKCQCWIQHGLVKFITKEPGGGHWMEKYLESMSCVKGFWLNKFKSILG